MHLLLPFFDFLMQAKFSNKYKTNIWRVVHDACSGGCKKSFLCLQKFPRPHALIYEHVIRESASWKFQPRNGGGAGKKYILLSWHFWSRWKLRNTELLTILHIFAPGTYTRSINLALENLIIMFISSSVVIVLKKVWWMSMHISNEKWTIHIDQRGFNF